MKFRHDAWQGRKGPLLLGILAPRLQLHTGGTLGLRLKTLKDSCVKDGVKDAKSTSRRDLATSSCE